MENMAYNETNNSLAFGNFPYDSSSNFQPELFTKGEDVAVGIVLVVFAIGGVTLNILTIFAVVFGRNINQDFKIQIINMAVADTLFAATYPIMTFISHLRVPLTWTLSACQFTRSLVQSFLHASPLCNAAISVERFFRVFFPGKAAQYCRTRNYVLVGLVWAGAVLPELETLIHARVVSFNGRTYCFVDSPLANISHVLNEWLITMKYVIPSLIVLVCYVSVCIKLGVGGLHQSDGITPEQWKTKVEKVQLMLVVDAILTLITWLPYNLHISITETISRQFYQMYTIKQIFTMDITLIIIMSTNVFSTPLVYAIFNKHFRRDVKLLWRKIRGNKDTKFTSETNSSSVRLSELPAVSQVESRHM